MEQGVHQENVGALVTELDSNTDLISAVDASNSNSKKPEPSKPGSQALPNEIMLMIIQEAVVQDIQNVEDARNRQEPPRNYLRGGLPELVARPRIECMSVARTNTVMRELVMGTFFKDYRAYVATWSLEAHDWLFDTSNYGNYERTLRDGWDDTTLPEQIRPPPRTHIRHLRLDAEVFWLMWHAPPALANFPALQTLIIQHDDQGTFGPDPWMDYFPKAPVSMSSDDEDGPWQDIFHCLTFFEDLLVKAPNLRKISIEREWLPKIQFASWRFGREGNGGIPTANDLFARVNFSATLDNVMTCVLEDMIANKHKIPLTEESKYKIAFKVCDYMFTNM